MKRFTRNLVLFFVSVIWAAAAHSAVSVVESHTDVNCYGDSTGSINITAFNGTAPYSYLWNGGVTTEDRNNLSAGTYSVTVTDNTGATTTISVTITEPSLLTTTLSAIAVSCHSGSNGAINNTVSGGRSPYSYSWNDGGFTKNRTGLAAATYTVTVTDLNGCTATASIFVPQPAFALTVTAVPSPLACLGGPSGSAVANATGGTPPYSYWWGGGIVDSFRINLVSGTYCVTATDSKGCPANACATIPAYTPLSISSIQTDNVCFNDSIGSVDVTVNDGSTPYTYLWTTGSTAQDLTNLKAGSYTITVIDNNSCTASRSVTIAQPAFPISTNTTIADVTCNGANDGSINMSIVNGTSPYTFLWGDGATTQNRTALNGGNYSVTIMDNNGCSAISSATVSEPSSLVATASAVDVNCFGDSTGGVNVTAFGSFAPYVYSWSDGAGDIQNRTGMLAGNYSVLLIDNHGCSASASATVSQPVAPLSVSYVTGDVTCFGGDNGWINLTSTGGTAPYSYDWGSGVVSQNRTNLSAGNYTTTIIDNAGCSFYVNPVIEQPDSIFVSSTITEVTCNGGNNGEINLQVTGGTAPYAFDWGGGVTSQNRTGLSVGSYTVVVSDSFGCTAVHTGLVTQISPLTVSAAVTNVTCSGLSNGEINTSVSGGTVPYSFTWNDGVLTQYRTSLSAGSYFVTVTDANTCTAFMSATVTEPAPIVSSATVVAPTCFGEGDGSIDLIVSGGAGGYLYAWSNNVYTEDLSNVTAGSYLVNITDMNNCVASASILVNQPASVSLNTTQINVGCSSPNSGSIDLTVTGGVLPYTYSWNTSDITEDISSLAVGSYSVLVLDSNSCSASLSVNITQVSPIVITETHTHVLCYSGNDGSINISAAGGSLPYTFTWADGILGQTRTDLTSGTYTISATDNTGCSASLTINIIQPTALLLNVNQANVACNGTATGSIDLTVSGGTGSYFYLWNDSSLSQDKSGVTAGSYSVTVMDANSCSASTTVVLTQPTAIQTTLTKVDVSCFGASDGGIDLSVMGGQTPYSFVWTNNALTEDVNNIPAGNYTVVLTDANNCSSAESVTILQPTPIQAIPAVTAVSCFGGSDGKIDLSMSGGASSYGFVWNNLSSTEDIAFLTAGSYSVSVTDANGCSASFPNIIVTQPNHLNIITDVVPVSCTNRNDGAIYLTVTGGTVAYTYEWSNQSSSGNITGLSVGSYSATVTDDHGCVATISENVEVASPIVISSATKNTACKQVETGAVDLTVDGGTPYYRFKWSNGNNSEDVNQISGGDYTVTVTDSRDCSAEASFVISFDYVVEVEATTSSPSIKSGETVQLSALSNVDHGNTFSWFDHGDLICSSCGVLQVTPRMTTFYTLSMEDENGCKAQDTLTVEVNSINDIFIPNVFTPNNDGNNDVLQLRGDLLGITYLSFSIFNRWGEQVFETSDHNFTWDGTYKGLLLPQGVYVYRIKTVFGNEYSRNHTGSITILR